ncbi:MAG: hypothetical protein A3C06_00925 [Candidatus Taylorbacteria bacterium RIFCSPHIGHO2_02_FULL_46_13]|uniref:YdbS-like PH domain-containing protein n=2 Tax=Parcubacteria group TaxID=1794811 RepID=A0A1G2HVW4_9BACT|nr:MAG: hypothetical protein A2822_01365 [Candidatus Staskawiczbacteria bacterium RIFCSPHIGHO2_01_FULL_41_41]OHA27264.1 MAG: hypothetical protein A3C06_00925 [Candidatus Taylorbacteria bacterium RIFCSPHIGHO2_02_FULL_46_13]
MTYEHIWSKVVSPDEEIRYVFSISSRYIYIYLTIWAFIGLATIWFYGVGAVIFLIALFYYAYYLRVSNAYAFTTKRVLIHHGWLSTSITSLDYSKVTAIQVQQLFFERLMFGTGTLTIDTAGTEDDKIILRLIQNPHEVKRALSEIMDESLKRHTSSIGSSPPVQSGF